MNVPDLRNVDFDAYRQQAQDLRRQAMNESIDRALASLKALLRGRSAAAPVRAPGSAPCHA
jgi:hypothetical protein